MARLSPKRNVKTTKTKTKTKTTPKRKPARRTTGGGTGQATRNGIDFGLTHFTEKDRILKARQYLTSPQANAARLLLKQRSQGFVQDFYPNVDQQTRDQTSLRALANAEQIVRQAQ